KGENNKNIPADYWVWSPHGTINMHMPEKWGYVQFSETEVGKGNEFFKSSMDEHIKNALRELYYQQKNHYHHYQYYITEIDSLDVPQINFPDYDFQPRISGNSQEYIITAAAVTDSVYWHIYQDGKIEWSPRK
ncbi:MAG: carbohydrate-binding family 9-like protein, partial [Bacteroidota bacterium]